MLNIKRIKLIYIHYSRAINIDCLVGAKEILKLNQTIVTYEQRMYLEAKMLESIL